MTQRLKDPNSKTIRPAMVSSNAITKSRSAKNANSDDTAVISGAELEGVYNKQGVRARGYIKYKTNRVSMRCHI